MDIFILDWAFILRITSSSITDQEYMCASAKNGASKSFFFFKFWLFNNNKVYSWMLELESFSYLSTTTWIEIERNKCYDRAVRILVLNVKTDLMNNLYRLCVPIVIIIIAFLSVSKIVTLTSRISYSYSNIPFYHNNCKLPVHDTW